MDPNTPTPPAQNPEPPKQDDPPAWAQQLIDSTTQFNDRLDKLEENLQPPAPEEPPVPETNPEAWQPKSWEDVANKIEETAEQLAQRKLDERDQAAIQASEQEKKTQEEVDQYLDKQVDELRTAGFLPKIEDTTNADDPGKLAEKELYGYAMSMGTADLVAVSKSLQVLHDSGKMYDFVKGQIVDRSPEPLGRSVPVGSSSAGATGTKSGVDYKTIQNNSLDSLADRFLGQ